MLWILRKLENKWMPLKIYKELKESLIIFIIRVIHIGHLFGVKNVGPVL